MAETLEEGVGTAPAVQPPRDRARTAARILEAGRAQLLEGRLSDFGVNAIARRAGCDKQLIYRYFGGIDGLAAAIGRALGEGLPLQAVPEQAGYMERVETLLLNLLEALRRDPLALRVIALTLAEPAGADGPVRRLSEAHAEALQARLDQLAAAGGAAPPLGVDAPAVNALLLGAVQHALLSAAARGSLAGLPLTEDRNWIRVRLALRSLIRGVYRVGRPAELPPG